MGIEKSAGGVGAAGRNPPESSSGNPFPSKALSFEGIGGTGEMDGVLHISEGKGEPFASFLSTVAGVRTEEG